MYSKASRTMSGRRKKKVTRIDKMDFLNETGFAYGIGVGMIDEEGSVELDESEVFADENESMVNLRGIVGTKSGDGDITASGN